MKSILLLVLITMHMAVQANETLFVVTEDLPPLNYVDDKTIKGHHTSVVKAILKSANIDYSIAILPWARSYKIAQTQPNILIYTINHTKARHDQFHWIAQFPTNIDLNYYALKSSKLVGLQLPDLKKLRIGTQFSTSSDEFLVNNGFSKISRVSHIRQTMGMLERKRIDLVIASPAQIKNIGGLQEKVEKIGKAYTAIPSVAVSLSTPLDTVEKLRKAYATLSQSIDLCTFMELNKPACAPSMIQL